MIANRRRLHWQRNKDHGEKLGLSANGRKKNIRGSGGVPKCSEIKKTGPRNILYQAYDMRVLCRYADMSACRKMPCVLIFPAK
jgi:hypothetical protein